MREILFRGKTKDSGDWVYGNLKKCAFDPTPDSDYDTIRDEYYISLFDGHSMDLGGWNDGEQLFEVIPETVGQYTGLTDKNGTKIFEGNIVLYLPNNENMTIEYWADLAMFQVVGDFWTTDFAHISGYDVEVIGNIFDNPYLLEGDAENVQER